MDEGTQGRESQQVPVSACVFVTYSFSFSPFFFFFLGLVFVRYGECVEDVMLLRTKMHALNSIVIICTIFIFLSLFLAVFSTLLVLVFSFSFVLGACFLLSLLLYDSFIS